MKTKPKFDDLRKKRGKLLLNTNSQQLSPTLTNIMQAVRKYQAPKRSTYFNFRGVGGIDVGAVAATPCSYMVYRCRKVLTGHDDIEVEGFVCFEKAMSLGQAMKRMPHWCTTRGMVPFNVEFKTDATWVCIANLMRCGPYTEVGRRPVAPCHDWKIEEFAAMCLRYPCESAYALDNHKEYAKDHPGTCSRSGRLLSEGEKK